MIELILIVIGVALALSIVKALKSQQYYNPFELWEMWSRMQCNKCNYLFDKKFKRFEYVNQTVTYFCTKCGEDTKHTIIGIFFEEQKTPEQLKWEAFEEKWR